jgi:ADP-ribose pyrophosphatase
LPQKTLFCAAGIFDNPRKMTDLTETQLSSAPAFKGKLLDVRCDTVRLPDGKTGTREYIVHPGAVMVIPIFDNGDLLVEHQFRYPIGKVMIEFPAGKLDSGEEALTAAKRELQEETGYTATHWEHLHTHHPLIAYSTERIEFYIAKGLTPGPNSLDAGEFLRVERLALSQLLAQLDAGNVTDGKTVAGLFLAMRRGFIAPI